MYVLKFHNRTGAQPPKNVIASKSKRVWHANTSVSEGSVLKRSRLLAKPSTKVTLFFAEITSDRDQGLQHIEWIAENSTPHTVTIVNGENYVSKRCYTIGDNLPMSILANRDQLVKEAITLGRAEFFLDNFNKECENDGVEISEFKVTDFILAREGTACVNDRFEPSPASGVDSSHYLTLSDAEKDEITSGTAVISSITWLLERERGDVELRKYSGTLDHPRYSDKQGATINAFQHFTYLYSNETLVLADIQASESHDPKSQAAILFDLMSHTATGGSGAGDHGEKGIQTFLDQHECVQKCALLSLKPLREPEALDADEEDNGSNSE
ncbi:kinase-like protein [Favolaschia claudopus]|uniref:Kinase-like protein n=1 Tax=Favolaschia claudopus TaxID=2862362 RepID=A0AAW0ATI3_9AGAR